jgi:hypothetical protein
MDTTGYTISDHKRNKEIMREPLIPQKKEHRT